MKLEDEIKQKTFKNEYHKAHLNVLYTSTWLTQHTTEILKTYKISWQQFNILRILRGMQPQPATVKILTERMIDKMSNASRLVDKLEDKGLAQRTTSELDRRQVDIFITQQGLDLVKKASIGIERDLERYMSSISETEAKELNRILDKMRG